MVTPAFPEVPADTAVALDQLGELLGADHDLAELAGLVGQSHHLCPDPLERSLLFGLVRHRRSEILGSAAVMGRRLFAEEPEEFALRIALYWETGRLGGR